MSFPAYPAYQDSGVEWLGQIPAAWDQVPFWALFRRVKRSGYSDEQLLSVYRDYGVVRKADRDDNFNKPSEDLSAYQLVEEGDLAINKMKAWQGSVGISEHRGIVSPAYFVYRSLHTQDNRFLHYLLRSAEYTAGYLSLSKGIRVNQWDLDPAYHSRMPVVLPSRDEQVAIAAFLDRETGKIDALIEEQRRLIVLLKEKRQAVISHAVTKGLDPHIPMKDSEIDWFGEVPAHWDIRRLKQIVPSVTVGIVVEPSKHYVEEGIPALRSLNVRPGRIETANLIYISEEGHEFHSKSRLNAGDIVAVRTGQPGTAAIVPNELDGCNCIDLIVIRKGELFSEQFLCWYLQAEAAVRQFAEGSGGAIQLHFNIGTAVNLVVPLPPLAEQEEVAAALTTKIAEIDGVITTADQAIALLIERRAALISAAVTGKIDVRASAKLLPFPVDRGRARGLVATEIIERSAGQPTFGRVKFQKVAYLAEGHVGISELAGSYTREAAGPLDRALIDEMESGAGSIAGIAVDQQGGTGTAVSYRLGQHRGAHHQELADWLGADRTAKLDKLIADFAPLTTKQAEAVATLYGVWNDALSEGNSPTDDEIISGFLNDWHPEKREKFRASELPEWLGWMRRHHIVPTGSGPKTTTGRLFV